MEMTPETGMILSVLAGIAMVCAGIWYFLPGRTQQVLGAIWGLVKAIFWPGPGE
jgi:hypothetical protein